MCALFLEKLVFSNKLQLTGIQLDRNAIASARLNNMEEDLGLEGSQYNTCISVLFAGLVYSSTTAISQRQLTV